jgi:capsular polysaccharide biosynthesis protein
VADDIDSTLRMAKSHIDAGRFAEAAALLDLVLGGGAKRPEALLLRGIAAQRLDDHRMALACLERAAALAPGSELIGYNHAVALQAAGRLNDAAGEYRRAIALKAARLGLDKARLESVVFDGRVDSVRGWALANAAEYRAWPCAADDSRPLPAHVYEAFVPAPNEDFLAVIDDASVVAGSVRASHFQYVLTADRALLADRLNLIPRYHLGHGFSFAKTISPDGAALIDLLDYPPHPKLAGRYVLLGGVRNYYHWLFEYLPRIELVRRCPDLAIDGWLVNAEPARFQLETLAALGIAAERLVPMAVPCVLPVERLYVPSVRRLADAVAFLRRQFAPPGIAATRRLFVSRKDAATSRIANEDDVFAALEPLGFERVLPGTMGVADQAALFASAAIVVGVHGAALANIVFAHRDARIVELGGGRTRGFGFYAEIARVRGQAHRLIAAEGEPPTIDPAAVARVVKQFL